MIRTCIRLPDGTEVFSGAEAVNAIKSVTFTECVNADRDLTLGSVCANSVEIKLITPGGGLTVNAGDEITVFTVDEEGVRRQVGVFITEKPTRPSANTMSITAYDRVIKLDKDLSTWLESLTGWPYRVVDLARMAASECGLTLKNTELLNGDYLIQKFSGSGITGRKLMEWVGQIAAKFCRATPEGDIEFAWYTNKFNLHVVPAGYTRAGSGYGVAYGNGDLSITAETVSATDDGAGNVTLSGLAVVYDDGNGNFTLAVDDGARTGLPYAMGSLTYEEYETAPIEKVQLRLTDSDIGAVYPQLAEEVNTYILTGNFLLTGHDPAALETVAKGIYEAVCHIRYTPCQVDLFAGSGLQAGDVVTITDANGKTFTTYLMTHTRKGQKDTFTCTGSHRRDSSEAVNRETVRSLSGKMLEVRKSIDGLKVQATSLDSSLAEVREQVAAVDLTAEGLTAEVSSLTTAQSLQEDALSQTKEHVSRIQQAADSISLRVKSIEDDGAKKVDTGMGYTFDDKGLTIQKDGEAIKNKLDATGMQVTRSEEIMLRADKDGVLATDVKVRNFLIVGDHARFENYSDGSDTKRTACFYIEEVANGT